MVTPFYDDVVMQGGGVRCLWQAGFLSVVSPHWEQAPRRILAVSAGAAIACAFAAGQLDVGVAAFREAVSRNRKNFYFSNLLSRKPAFPHLGMYRRVLSEVLSDSGMKALRLGPDVRILLSRPAPELSSLRLNLLLLGIGFGRQISSARMVSKLIRAGRFSTEFVPVGTCHNAADVTDLVLASSSTPPFTPLLSYRGRPALDGGLLEPVPMSALPGNGARALVLLTSHRTQPQLPQAAVSRGITIARPSLPIDGEAWDYANPRLLDRFHSLGREDGARFIEAGK